MVTIKKLAFLVIATALISLIGGISAGKYFFVSTQSSPESPQSLITANVEKRVVSSSLKFDGEVSRPIEFEIQAPLSTSNDAAHIITQISATQEPVSECQLLLAINNRPIFIMRGRLPAYRTLSKDDAGSDILQLQQSLRNCDYEIPASESGVLGPSTFSAVAEMYGRAGFSLSTSSDVIPYGEVLFVPQTPVVVSTTAPVGTDIQTVSVFAQAGPLSLISQAPVDAEKTFEKGQVAVIQTANNENFEAQLVDFSVATGIEGSYLRLQLMPQKQSFLDGLSTFRAEFVLSATNKATLAIPGSALWLGDGSNYYVTKVEDGGSTQEFQVKVGLCGNGWCQILEPSQIREGDKIAVGLDTKSVSGNSEASIFQ